MSCPELEKVPNACPKKKKSNKSVYVSIEIVMAWYEQIKT